jgi:prevent-host-death family protein
MVRVTAEEAQSNLPDLIEKAVNGETVFITQDGYETVQLVPVLPSERRPRFGSAKGLIAIAEDFDEPLEEFDEYMPKEIENGNQK